METKPNTGAIFRNDKKTENQPDYKGKINVDGKDYDIALWERTGKDSGRPYLSAKISEPYRKEEAPPPPIAEQTETKQTGTDDLPY